MNLKEKVIMITGANSGIGKEAAIELAKEDAHIVMVCRNEKRGEEAQEEIIKKSDNENVDLLIADLSSLESVDDLVTTFRQEYDRLDILINNAGIFLKGREKSEDDIEKTFATNHLGHFHLTTSLLDILEKSSPSRIINVSSAAHKGTEINFDEILQQEQYSSFEVYGESKLANLLFTYELDKRLKDKNITVNALHPGFVASNFAKNNGLLYKIVMSLLRPFQRSVSRGAQPIIYLAQSDEVTDISGKYFTDVSLFPFFTKPKIEPVLSSNESYSEEAQKKLWELSEQTIKDKLS